jgi:MoaA/NifB/PqqE/SkfB family radical SAM enzyme
MDGASQQTYEQFRQSGSVSKVIKFAKAAVEAKKELKTDYPLINLRIIATKENEHEIDRVRKIAGEIGTDVFSVKSVSIYDEADPSNPHLPDDMNYRSFQYQGEESAREYKELPNLCYKPWSWPTLRYNGTLLACECDHESSRILGNVFEASDFREVWIGMNSQELRREFPANGKVTVEFCQRCRYKVDDAIREITHTL